MASARELDERKAAILRAIVSHYVRSGEPVGSRTVVERFNLRVSAATVRNEMALLEDAGFIVQPHTSAGRVPTDKGYRFFVDALAGATPLSEEETAAIERLLVGSADLEELLRRTSTVLSRLTRFAALVVAPRLDRRCPSHCRLHSSGACLGGIRGSR
jgi:heat-inducible transcriptional repressor